jgi:catechol 2,3-dioxygenase
MIRLWKLGHVNLRVSDEEKARWFYCDVLGLKIAERDPQHGGVFTTLGDNFHTLDFARHPNPDAAQKPRRDQLGLVHIAFQVESHDALREAYTHLLENGIAVDHATNHENQRSIYFRDPDGNGVEIYYEVPYALQLFPDGRSDVDEALEVGGADDPLPAWLRETWPTTEMQARIDAIRDLEEDKTPSLGGSAVS